MAFIATHTHAHARQRPFARAFAALGAYLVNYMENHSRYDRVQGLMALSDAELARRGLTRDTIVREVFADQLYL